MRLCGRLQWPRLPGPASIPPRLGRHVAVAGSGAETLDEPDVSCRLKIVDIRGLADAPATIAEWNAAAGVLQNQQGA